MRLSEVEMIKLLPSWMAQEDVYKRQSWTRSVKASRTSTPKGSAVTSPTWPTVWLQRSRPAT